MARLGEICDVRDGTHDSPPYVREGYPLVTSKNITDGKLDISNVSYISLEDYNKINERSKVNTGDIIMPMIGTIGNPYIVEEFTEFAIKNVALIKFTVDKVYNKYIFYFLNSEKFKEYIIENNRGGTQKFLSLKDIRNTQLTLPSLTEQLEVVEKLDKISAIISLRKQQLSKLDELVKARFVELFGEPITNPMGWEKVNISAVVGGKVSNGFFAKRDEYCDNGNVKVLGVANVVNRMYSNTEELPQTNGTEADIQKYGVKYGDMLFCRSSLVAAGIGKASIVPKGVPSNVLFECHVIRLPLDLNKCVPEFMQVLSTTDYFRNQVISQSKTATMTTIGQDGILKTEIILPPLELQKQFLSFVKQTDKSKLAIQKSLEKLETMKKALMQKYFG